MNFKQLLSQQTSSAPATLLPRLQRWHARNIIGKKKIFSWIVVSIKDKFLADTSWWIVSPSPSLGILCRC